MASDDVGTDVQELLAAADKFCDENYHNPSDNDRIIIRNAFLASAAFCCEVHRRIYQSPSITK